ncbi:serine protease 27-like [Ascaphus truei]|uniref:serine protease 27-like n=1 Tax=Ascaphus truei TaxID=8439 RepID=UPI003F5ACC6A
MMKLVWFLLLHQACGIPLISDRIVGGKDATRGSWPWQVSLQTPATALCGGSLITDTWVLIAAHCFGTPVKTSEYTVYLGAYQLSDLKSSNTTVSMGVSRVIVHPDYMYEGSSGDVALVELERPVTFTKYILPVCLPSQAVQLVAGTRCWVTGWGDVKSGVSLPGPKTLQEVDVLLIDNMSCEAMYQSSLGYDTKIHLIHEDMICAGYKEGLRDSCQGDSGGPLVCNINNVWLQAGIVSWGYDCAKPNQPGVYTRVQTYQGWIRQYVPSIEFSDGGNSMEVSTTHPVVNTTKTQLGSLSVSNSTSSRSDGTTIGSSRSDGTTIRSSKSDGTTIGSSRSDGTTIRSSMSDGTTIGSSRSDGTTVRSSRSDGTTVRSSRSDGTTIGSSRSDGTTIRSSRSDGTTIGSSRSEGTTIGNSRLESTTIRSSRSDGTTIGSSRLESTTIGSYMTDGTTMGRFTDNTTVSWMEPMSLNAAHTHPWSLLSIALVLIGLCNSLL